MTETFFNAQAKHCLSVRYTPEFYNELHDEYGVYEHEDEFDYMDRASFYEFFDENAVDIPCFFAKTKSVKRGINELEVLKFNNYFMRKGKRYKSLKLIYSVLWDLFNEFKNLEGVVFNSFFS